MFCHTGNTLGSAPFNVTAPDDFLASTISDSMPRPCTSTKTFRWTPSPRRAHGSRGRFEPTEFDRLGDPGLRRPEVWDRYPVVIPSRSRRRTLSRWDPSILHTPSTTLGIDRPRSSWRSPPHGTPLIPTETLSPPPLTTVRIHPASSARPIRPPSRLARAAPAGGPASRRPSLRILDRTACMPAPERQVAGSAFPRVGTRFSRLTALISAAPSSTRPRSTFPTVAPTLQAKGACCRHRRHQRLDGLGETRLAAPLMTP